MKSFRFYPAAGTHWTGILLGWSALIGLCSTVGLRLWILANRDRGWYLAPDANPTHWTRSSLLSLVLGLFIGLVIGGLHLFARRFKKRL